VRIFPTSLTPCPLDLSPSPIPTPQTGRMQGLGIGSTLARILEVEGVRGLFK